MTRTVRFIYLEFIDEKNDKNFTRFARLISIILVDNKNKNYDILDFLTANSTIFMGQKHNWFRF